MGGSVAEHLVVELVAEEGVDFLLFWFEEFGEGGGADFDGAWDIGSCDIVGEECLDGGDIGREDSGGGVGGEGVEGGDDGLDGDGDLLIAEVIDAGVGEI